MCNRVTLDRTTAKLIVGSHGEGVRKPCSESVYVEVCLIEVSQVSIWDIQFSYKYTLDCSYDDLCELQTPSVCIVPADCDHTIRRCWCTRTHRSRDWEQREKQSCQDGHQIEYKAARWLSLILCPDRSHPRMRRRVCWCAESAVHFRISQKIV